MFSLKGKSTLVTGAGSGIGRAIANLFAQSGAFISVVDLNPTAAEETVAQIRKDNGRAAAYPGNVADQEAVDKVVGEIVADAGRIDIVVNSAGISHVGNIEKTTSADFERVFSVNVKGVYNVMHAVVEKMKAQGGGCILNIGSVSSSSGIKDRFAYSMSKGAVLSMTLSVAKDYIKHNIRCNCISPARVHTSFVDDFLKKNYPGQEQAVFERLSKTQPIGRMGTPEEVAALALYLCSDEAAFVTGADYVIDGGFLRLNTGE